MQDALTLAFDMTAIAAVAYLSTEFCLGLAERAAHPQPTPATPAVSPSVAAAPVTAAPVTTAAVATIPVTATPPTSTSPGPIPGAVQPLLNLSAVPKPEPEYLPLKTNPLPNPLRPNPIEDTP